jgi:hypothetical protein
LSPSDWFAWAIRLLIPAIGYVAWQAYTDLQKLSAKVDVIDYKIDSHTQQLNALWSRTNGTAGQPSPIPHPTGPPP